MTWCDHHSTGNQSLWLFSDNSKLSSAWCIYSIEHLIFHCSWYIYRWSWSTQPSALHGTVKWVSASGLSNNKWQWWMRMVAAISGRITVQVGWLGLRVGGHLGAESAFIKWTGWTLAMALPWWQHHKYHLGYYYCYYCCCCYCCRTEAAHAAWWVVPIFILECRVWKYSVVDNL